MRIRVQYKLNAMLWMLACMLFAGSCQRDETMPESLGAVVNLGLNLGTYALGDDDTNALPHEKQIQSLYVFIYNADGLLANPGKTKITAASGGSLVDATGRINGSWKVYEGQKTVYVLANVPAILKTTSGSIAAADVLNAPTLAVLQDLCNDNNSYYADYCLNQGATWTGGLMSGSTTAAVTTAKSEVVVPLTRRYARIDLAVKKSPELASATVKVTGVQWQNFCPDARLLALSSEWRGTNTSYKVTGLQNSFILTSDYIRVRPKTTGAGGVEYEIYVMPKPLNGEFSIPVALQLDVDINGKTESYTIYLAETAADGTQDPIKPLAIQANKIYKVNATLLRRSTDVDITIKDWEDQAILGDVAGTYLIFSQTKVLMDWWALGQTFKANVDFRADGTVSFVGYVLKNANGTDKSVTADGTNMPSWLNASKISGLPGGTTKKGTITAEYNVSEGVNPDVYLRFKTGNIIKDIQFVYDNGFIPTAKLKSQGWPEALLPSGGIQVAKRGNVNPNYDALAADPKAQWATSTTTIPSAVNTGYGVGLSNTDAVIAALGTNPLNSAAAKCRALGPGWYLMSSDEEVILYKTQALLSALSYSFIYKEGGGYWTSSEAQVDLGQYSYYIVFNYNGLEERNEKTNANMNLRCVRNIDAITLSTTQLTADYANWGNRFSTDVTFKSSNGTVSIQSIDNSGATKNWLTSAVVSGSTSGKITVTYAPTKNATHDDVAIILKTTSGGTQTLTVKYDNGLIPASALPAEWTLNRPSVGIQSAKKGNNLPNGTADVNWDKEVIRWATSSISVPAAQAQGYGYGASNTTAIITALGAGATAANKCRSLGPDWYFSSLDELQTVCSSRNYLGSSYSFTANLYWSATEDGSNYSWYVYFGSGNTNNYYSNKTLNCYVRCVRNY